MWAQTPTFPVPAGRWTPDPGPPPVAEGAWQAWRLLTLAHQITATPALTLQALTLLGVEQQVHAAAVVELAAELHLALDTAVTVEPVVDLAAELHLAVQQAITAVPAMTVAAIRDIDLANAVTLTGAVELLTVKDLAAQLAVVASSSVELTRYALLTLTAAWQATAELGMQRVRPLAVHLGLAATPACAIGFPPLSPTTATFTTVGSTSWNFPKAADHLDLIAVGGGASGQTGSGVINRRGDGGIAGHWAAMTVTRGVDVPWSARTVAVTVGAGGAQPANSDHAGPNWGGASTMTIDGAGTITANGGDGKVSGQNGENAGTYPHNGQNYVGGNGGTGNGGAGQAPGGAGAGGNGGILGSRTRGGAGARGQCWGRAYQ